MSHSQAVCLEMNGLDIQKAKLVTLYNAANISHDDKCCMHFGHFPPISNWIINQ